MQKYHAPFGGGQKEKQVMLLAGCPPYVVHHPLMNKEIRSFYIEGANFGFLDGPSPAINHRARA